MRFSGHSPPAQHQIALRHTETQRARSDVLELPADLCDGQVNDNDNDNDEDMSDDDGDEASGDDWKAALSSYERRRLRLYRDTMTIFASKKDNKEGLLDSFDGITRLVMKAFKVQIVVFSLVGTTDVTFISSAGTTLTSAKRAETFCHHMVEEDAPESFTICDASKDEKFKDSPLVVNAPFIRFYVGVPIMVHNYKVGALSIADSSPRTEFSEYDINTLTEFAGVISDIITEQRKKLMSIESDYAKITVGLFSHLKKPLLKVEEAYREAHSVYVCRSDSLKQKQSSPEFEMSSQHEDSCCCSTVNRSNALVEHKLETAIDNLSHSIDFLNMVTENCVQLSLSLFEYLNPHQALELVHLTAVPSMVEDLIQNVTRGTLPKGMKEPIQVVLNSSAFNAHNKNDDKSVSKLISINLSMVWMILYSILSCECKCAGKRLRIVLSLHAADPTFSPMLLAIPQNKESVNAMLSMRFIFETTVNLDKGDPLMLEAPNSAHCTMENALDYLLHSFGGKVTNFEANPTDSATQILHRRHSRSPSLTAKVIKIDIPCEVRVKAAAQCPEGPNNTALGSSVRVTPLADPVSKWVVSKVSNARISKYFLSSQDSPSVLTVSNQSMAASEAQQQQQQQQQDMLEGDGILHNSAKLKPDFLQRRQFWWNCIDISLWVSCLFSQQEKREHMDVDKKSAKVLPTAAEPPTLHIESHSNHGTEQQVLLWQTDSNASSL